MWRAIILVLGGTGVVIAGFGQVKKQFSVEKSSECDRIELCLKAKTGNCFIRPSQNNDALNIYSNQDLEEYSHSFSNEIKGKTCMVKLALEEEDNKGVSQKISYHVFGGNEKPNDKFWKVYLTENTPYSLNLDYGLGNANIDLSGLAVDKLKINTGSADVNIAYSSGMENKIDMDTFYVKVDMGSVNARQIQLSRSKVVVADVGFGNMYLDFSDRPLINNHVKGSVGAGNLVIVLPQEDVPVLVRVNDSWLCSISLSRSLKKIASNTFANAAYSKKPNDALTFDLDVSMGKIVFKEK